MTYHSEIELMLTAASPPGGEHHERFARPHALAELQRRGTDLVALAARVRALTAELRKLPVEDLKWMEITDDPEGLWLLAAAVLEGRDPLGQPRAQHGQVKREPGPAPGERA